MTVRSDLRDEAVARRTERWFVRQGVPQLIADYGFRSHVLPRMLPFLVAVPLGSITLAVVLTRIRSGLGAVAITLLILVGVLALPWLPARAGRVLPQLSRRGATIVLAGYAATPVVVPLLLLGVYGRADRALVIGRPGTPTIQVAVATGLVLAAALAALFIVAAFVTSYGLVPLATRAARHAFADMRGSLQLQGRAMPTLLFVTFFLFFTSELWQLMNHLAWGRLVLVLVLFAAVTVLATAVRLRGEVDRVEHDLNPERLAIACAGTPLAALGPKAAPSAPPPLTARQETNVLMVLAARQLVQAAVVGLGLFTFFVILGLIVVDRTIATAWIGTAPDHSAWAPFLPVALLRAAALLAGFGSMYFAITAMTQQEYRQEFFEPVISDVERTLAVRAVYLDIRPVASQRTA
jgi:MFS family permease